MSSSYRAGFYLAPFASGRRNYLHFQDETTLQHRGAGGLDDDVVADVFDRLTPALPVALPAGGAPGPGQQAANPVRRAMEDPLWVDPQALRELLEPLAEQVLPAALQDRLDGHGPGDPLRLKVGAGGRWALLPWELLPLRDGRLLVDAADVQASPPVSLVHDRQRHPADPTDPDAVPLYVVDPDSGAAVNASVVDGKRNPALDLWRDKVAAASGWANDADGTPPQVGRHDLSQALTQQPPTRMLYLGHCYSADTSTPAQTGLVLSDRARPEDPGSVRVSERRTADRWRRPLTARDLYEGEQGMPGHQVWPMPPRVALIACASGTDAAQHEPWGLVSIMINAGAEYVTGTRWTIPTDLLSHGATTAFAAAVDHAHDSPDPISSLGAWIRTTSQDWRAHPQEARLSPVVWAAATTYLARRRATDPPP